MKNILKGINSRLVNMEEWISDLEDRIVGITQSEQENKKRILKNEDSIRDLWDNITCPNISHYRDFRERRERERGRKNNWTNNFWKLS